MTSKTDKIKAQPPLAPTRSQLRIVLFSCKQSLSPLPSDAASVCKERLLMCSPVDRADLKNSLWHLLYSQLRDVKQFSLWLLCRAWLVQPCPEISSKKKKKEAIKNTHTSQETSYYRSWFEEGKLKTHTHTQHMPSYICLIHLLSQAMQFQCCTTPAFHAKKNNNSPTRKMPSLVYSCGLSCFSEHLLIWHRHNTEGSGRWGLRSAWEMWIAVKPALPLFMDMLRRKRSNLFVR